MKKLNKNNKGFSLVELLVVIAIMVVLVGVIAPTLLSNIEKTREAKDYQALDTLAGNVQSAMIDEDVYDAIIANATGTPEKICTINLVNAYNGNAFATEPKAGVNTKFQNLLKDYLAQDAVFKTNAGTTTFNVFGAKAAKAGTTLQAKVNTTTGSITVEFTDGTNVIDGKSIKYSVTR